MNWNGQSLNSYWYDFDQQEEQSIIDYETMLDDWFDSYENWWYAAYSSGVYVEPDDDDISYLLKNQGA